jgi:hypothetical protein
VRASSVCSAVTGSAVEDPTPSTRGNRTNLNLALTRDSLSCNISIAIFSP